jgi:uncharacterized glyoxalase superfamily protein PhnB
MTPFEQLRDLAATAEPGPDTRFASRLRAEIEAALAPTIQLPTRAPIQEDATMATATPTTTTQIITPYISVEDATSALQWYGDAFDAEEMMRYTADDGRIGHAEIVIAGARIFLSDPYPEIGVVSATSHEGSSCALHLEVADVDAVHARLVAAGATEQMPPGDQSHGARHSTVIDPYGIRWMLSQPIATPSVADIDAATPGFTVSGGDSVTASRPIQLGYYTIRTGDVARAAHFYSQLFGWDVDPDSGHVSNCDVPFGFQNQFDDDVRLWQQVRDPDAVIARLVELGGIVVEDVNYQSGRGIECRDDQGNRFDLHEPAPGYE